MGFNSSIKFHWYNIIVSNRNEIIIRNLSLIPTEFCLALTIIFIFRGDDDDDDILKFQCHSSASCMKVTAFKFEEVAKSHRYRHVYSLKKN